MDKEYKELKTIRGCTIKDAVEELLEFDKKGELVCFKFNGHMLYSDTVDYEKAFKDITGCTVAEHEAKMKRIKEQQEKEEIEFKKALPQYIDRWIERGKRILTQDKHDKWIKIVPIRANDLYRGMELDACLDIIMILNNDGTLEKAKQKIESQNHSGMSFSLVCSMIEEFCERGSDFVKYVRKNPL